MVYTKDQPISYVYLLCYAAVLINFTYYALYYPHAQVLRSKLLLTTTKPFVIKFKCIYMSKVTIGYSECSIRVCQPFVLVFHNYFKPNTSCYT